MLKSYFRWKNNDATLDLNLRLRTFVKRGVFSGGSLTPVTGLNTKVAVGPFEAMSFDGMTIVEDATTQVTVGLDQTSIISVKAVYQIAADPILAYEVNEVSVFNNLIDKDYHIVLGAVTVSSLDPEVPASGISYLLRDVTDKVGRSPFRGLFNLNEMLQLEGDITILSDVISGLPGVSDLELGLPVTGPGIPSNSVIIAFPTLSSLQLNQAATLTAANQIFSFQKHSRRGTTTSGSNVLSNLTSTIGISVGWPVEGTNILPNTVVSSILSPTSIQISQNAAANGSDILIRFASLPLSDNRPQDFYIVGDDLGTTPALYAWNGIAWTNITDTVAVGSLLNQHRLNLLPNEKHLTDNEKDAALGSFGSPGLLNRYLTETDPRVLTAGGAAAGAGDYGTPSASNTFVTQEHPLANPEAIFFPLPPGGPIQITAAQGPTYVGTGIVGTAAVYFAVLNPSLQQGFLNALNINPLISGVFKDALLTLPLDPSVDADADGFYTGDVFLQTSSVVDTAFRLVYGHRRNLKTSPKGFSVETTPADDYVSGSVVEKIVNIKGRPYNTLIPTRESNASLRQSVDGLVSFLDSSVETSIVAANEDFLRLQNEPVLGNFVRSGSTTNLTNVISSLSSTVGIVVGMPIRGLNIPIGAAVLAVVNATTIHITLNATATASGVILTFGDFIKNIGVNPVYHYENTGLLTFAYTASTGLVQYSGAPVLTTVQIGDLFRDGAGIFYQVSSVNSGAFNINIINRVTGAIPNAITVSVGTSVDGSISVNNNPRDLLLSEMKTAGSTEFIPVRNLRPIPNEFESITGRLAYGVTLSDKRIEPRVAFYGAWEIYTDSITGESCVRNAGDQGDLVITGFFTNVILHLRRKSGSPVLNIKINEVTSGSVSTSGSGTISDNSATFGEKHQRVVLASIANPNVPSTVRATVAAAGADPLEIFGIEIVRDLSNSTMLMESGRAFRNTEIIKRDTINSAVPIFQVVNGARGSKTSYFLENNSHSFAQTNLVDYDESSSPVGSLLGTALTIILGVGKLENYQIDDLIYLTDGVDAAVRKISSIAGSLVTIDSATALTGTVNVYHWGSFNNSAQVIEEEETVRYTLTDLVEHTNNDFNPIQPAAISRTVVTPDTLTQIAGTNLGIVESGLTGTERAVSLNAGGYLNIRTLATRLDLIVNQTAAATIGVSIDGSPIYNIAMSGSGATRYTLFSNSRYQTHEVVITQISGTALVSQVILHGPKTPVPSGATKTPTASISQIAGYVDSGLIYPLTAQYQYLLGGVLFPAPEHLSYYNGSGLNPDWSLTLDFAKHSYGKYFATENDGSTADFYFTGDGFEIQMITGPDHGKCTIEVDGVNLTASPGTLVGSSYVGSKFDCYSAVYGRQNIGKYGLGFGLHHVKIISFNPREKNVSSTGYKIAIGGYYITNSDGYLTCGINKEGVFSGVEDLRIFLPVPLSNEVQQITSQGNEPISPENFSLVQPADGFLAIVVDALKVVPSDSLSKIRDTETNAAYDSPNRLYRILCDKSVTATTLGTAYTLSASPSFVVAAGDIIYDSVGAAFRRIDSVTTSTTGTIDAAFPVDLAAATCTVSQAVWTKDFVNLGNSSEQTRLRDFFSATDVDLMHVDYLDSLTAGDTTPDYIQTARVAVAVSNEGLQTDVALPTSDNFSAIFQRPTAPNAIGDITPLTPVNRQRCFGVFFCSPTNGSVVSGANLLSYQISLYEEV